MVIIPLCAFLAAAPAVAPPVQTLVGAVGTADASRNLPVELIFLGAGAGVDTYELPAQIPAELKLQDRQIPVVLERRPETAATVALPTGGFVRGAYSLQLPDGATGAAILSLPGRAGGGGFAFNLAAAPVIAAAQVSAPVPATAAADDEDQPRPRADSGNAFIRNFSAYRPIYAVFGPGTDTEARLQFSFKYQLFGKGGENGPDDSWLNNIQLGFTQRLYWDVRGQSSPFRNVDYQPEIFYLLPARRLSSGLSLGGQAGLMHESNGRDGAASRGFNTAYVQPTAEMPVGAYKFSLGLRLETYIGSISDNPDIARYRGNTELFAEVSRDDGLRITTLSRMSFRTGRGAINIEASYPLNRLVVPSLNLYLFGQAFIGYGENLLDYNIRTTRFRLGIAIMR